MAKWFKKVVSYFKGEPTEEQQSDDTEPETAWPELKTTEEDEDEETHTAVYKSLAEAVKETSVYLQSNSGPLSLYQIPLVEKQTQIKGCRRYTFGKKSHKRNRTIMVLGATGAGKSTLINGMINYILGIKWEDDFRFKLVVEVPTKTQAESQTSEVTAYKLNYQDGFQISYSLTIVDTPGFGDTGGIERDKEITEQIRNLFTSKSGVCELDAVCFVAQSALARLTPSQKYVFDSVLSIFGKDVAENIRVLVTFADGQRPPVLDAIIASGVPCPQKDGMPSHFKFNNSALFASNKSSPQTDEDEEDFDKMFWNMGTKSMKRFFDALNEIKTKSLTLTKEVLKERQQLEELVENLQKQVKVGLAKLEEIKETAEKLKEHEAEISRNEKFEIEVTVTEPVQEDISGKGGYITNCQVCYYTCHYPCGIPNDADKRGCYAMTRDGTCWACPGKCIWSVHYNQKYRWEYKEVTKKQTIDELKEKYMVAKNAKSPVEVLISNLKKEYDSVQIKVTQLMENSSKSLNRLKEIALKPNPLSTPEYIDMLIEGEKSEAKPGWKRRVQSLLVMREKAQTLAKIDKGETLLESSSTDITKTKGQKDNSSAKQSQTEKDTSQERSAVNQDKDLTATNTGQDTNENSPDQDTSENSPDQDTNKNSSDQDNMSENNPDQDTNKNSSDQDTSENSPDQDTNKNSSDQDTSENSPDQDTNKNSSDQDNMSENNPDQDTNKNSSDQDTSENSPDQDTNKNSSDQDTSENSPDQDNMSENNPDQDNMSENSPDQDTSENSPDQDTNKNSSDQDNMGENNPDQDTSENNPY